MKNPDWKAEHSHNLKTYSQHAAKTQTTTNLVVSGATTTIPATNQNLARTAVK